MMNIKAIFQAYTQLMQNPNQFLSQLGIPQECSNDPNKAIQYLMDNGKVTQEQFNSANNQLKQMQNNPLFKQLFRS